MIRWADVYGQQNQYEDALREALRQEKMARTQKRKAESGHRAPRYMAAAALALSLLAQILPHTARS